MPARPSRPEITEDRTYDKPRWIITLDGNPIRYLDTKAEADAWVDGYEYVWQR